MADVPTVETRRMYDIDGNPVDVPIDQVVDAHLRGGFAFERGSKIDVVDPLGRVYVVDEAEAEKSFRAGYRPATQADVEQDRLRQEYDTTAKGMAIAAAHGGYKAVTLGFGDALLPESALESIRHAEQFNPGIATAADVATTVGLAALSGGGSLAARGGAGLARRAVTAPMRALDATGRLVERGVGRLVGTEAASVGGRVAQSATRWGARGAAEAGIYEAGQAVSQAFIQDHELTAERLLAALGEGAVIGAIGGAAVGGLGRLGYEGGRATVQAAGRGITWTADQAREIAKGINQLAEKAFGKAHPELGEMYVKLQSAATGADPATLRRLGIQNLSDAGREARRIATFGAEEAQSTAVRNMRRDLDRLASATERMSEEARGGLKVEHVSKIIKRGNEKATYKAAEDFLANMKKSVSDMLADEGAYGQRANLKQALKTIEHYEKKLANSALEGKIDNAEIFADLDHLKQRIGKWSAPGRHIVSADQATHAVMRKHYESARQLLEAENLWGAAGRAQKEINEAWTRYLDTKELFEQAFARQGLKDEFDDFWTRKMVSDPAKIESYLKNIGLAKQDFISEVLQAHIKNSNELSSVIAKHFAIPSDKRHLIKEVVEASQALDNTLKKTQDNIGLINQLRALEAAENIAGTGLGAITSGAIGAAIGGPIGAVLGGAASIALHPARTIRQWAAIENLVGNVSSKIDGGISGFIKRATERAKEAAPELEKGVKKAGKAVVEATKSAGRWGYRAGVYTSSKVSESRRKEYERHAASVRRAMAEPEAFAGAIYARLGGDQVPPQIASSTIKTANRAMSFLNTKLPPIAPSRNPLQPKLEIPRVSDAEMSKFLRYAQAVERPISVLEDLENGRISREGVEALKAVYPRMYEEIRTGIASRVGEMNEKLTYSDRIQLGILFDVPTDASLDPAFIMAMQANYAQAEQNAMMAPSAMRPPRIAGEFETEVQRVGGA